MPRLQLADCSTESTLSIFVLSLMRAITDNFCYPLKIFKYYLDIIRQYQADGTQSWSPKFGRVWAVNGITVSFSTGPSDWISSFPVNCGEGISCTQIKANQVCHLTRLLSQLQTRIANFSNRHCDCLSVGNLIYKYYELMIFIITSCAWRNIQRCSR